MSKLTAQDQFLDLSDYGRPFGKFLANQLKNTRFTPIHVTLLFGVSGFFCDALYFEQLFFSRRIFYCFDIEIRKEYIR